ncbi:hypothetical protein [Halovivax sp.]|uniref:hypothetical protein n=1 Tax=Halovivax sp. TaxID=1935978 RepID=UPI0025C6D0E9|nr:hypothetical protein [Halovivax sp.]
MVEADSAVLLSLLTVAALAYFIANLVPRVDAMERSYRKFLSLTTLGIAYLLLLPLLAFVLNDMGGVYGVGQVLAIAVAAHVLFGLTLLYDVFDDWLRLFADPEYNTWVEASLVVAVVLLLAAMFLLAP